MSSRKTIIAGFIFVAALAFYLLDARRLADQQARQAQAARLLKFPVDRITSLSITRMGARLELRREGERWKIIHPVPAGADAQTVGDLLFYLDKQNTSVSIEIKPAERGPYGLDRPAVSLKIRAGTGEPEMALAIGDDSPVHGEVYATVDGGRTFTTVSAALRDQLLRSLYEYRDKSILPFNATEATHLLLNAEGRTIEVTRQAEGWLLVRPIKGPADDERIADILREINTTRVVDFMDTDTLMLDALGLSVPLVAMVSIGQGDPRTSATLMIGRRRSGENPAFYAQRLGSDQVFTVPPSLEAKLRPTVEDLRSKQLFTLAYDEVDRFSIGYASGTITLVKKGEDFWELQDSPNLKLDQEYTGKKLHQLLTLKVTKYYPVPPLLDQTGLDPPLITLSITGGGNGRTEQVMTGRLDREVDVVYARKGGSDETFAVDGSLPGQFILLSEDFHDKTFFDFKPADVVVIQLLSQNHQLIIRRRGDQWIAEREGALEPFQMDPDIPEAILLYLRQLKWTRKLDPASLSDATLIRSMGLDNAQGSLTLKDEDGLELVYFEVGGHSKKRGYLTLLGENEYYAIALEDYGKLLNSILKLATAQ